MYYVICPENYFYETVHIFVSLTNKYWQLFLNAKTMEISTLYVLFRFIFYYEQFFLNVQLVHISTIWTLWGHFKQLKPFSSGALSDTPNDGRTKKLVFYSSSGTSNSTCTLLNQYVRWPPAEGYVTGNIHTMLREGFNKKITRRTTGVKKNNFITRVFEIYFNLPTNHWCNLQNRYWWTF